MINNFRTMLIKFLAFLLISSILAYVSYFIVYKVSFLPNGYDIEAVQKDKISLKSFNLLGTEKDIFTRTFSGDDTWMIDDIQYQVKRQKTSFWMLFSFTTISLFLFVYKVRNGLKLWKAIFESSIIFSVITPLLPLINTLKHINNLIS
ncbi:hypothetical protein [Bacillus sp. B-jedd]|uniref:hypothetical protein n=1 Tax=Bacillus sp. B-jedd TaxID=1476857 RepID=UPI0005156815|nr:hypothetical protein [Bacillus sp. B-jedd]CEG27216.1 hypothetical protein BN1002_02072 [Bacillus sp. B-jedd]